MQISTALAPHGNKGYYSPHVDGRRNARHSARIGGHSLIIEIWALLYILHGTTDTCCCLGPLVLIAGWNN